MISITSNKRTCTTSSKKRLRFVDHGDGAAEVKRRPKNPRGSSDDTSNNELPNNGTGSTSTKKPLRFADHHDGAAEAKRPNSPRCITDETSSNEPLALRRIRQLQFAVSYKPTLLLKSCDIEKYPQVANQLEKSGELMEGIEEKIAFNDAKMNYEIDPIVHKHGNQLQELAMGGCSNNSGSSKKAPGALVNFATLQLLNNMLDKHRLKLINRHLSLSLECYEIPEIQECCFDATGSNSREVVSSKMLDELDSNKKDIQRFQKNISEWLEVVNLYWQQSYGRSH